MSVLTVTRNDDIVTVTLTRPERLNALNTELAKTLIAVGREIGADARVRAAILTGAGRAFCAGADLTPGALQSDAACSPGATLRNVLERFFNPVIETWALLPKPVIVAQNGIAAGGGVGLALCADYILMAESASHLLVFVPKLGLVPDMGVSYLLPRAIGAVRAARLALRGAPISSADAHAFGLAHAVVGDDVLQSRARQLALELALAPPGAFAAAKALMGPDPIALRVQLSREADVQAALGDSADHAEGVAAFIAKRAPRFNGG
jgi:2-(1,2-epoxy-1,2-dihydrophenyl)acetyl-CoA isomerase